MADEWERLTLKEWQAQGQTRFGLDVDDWKFMCPNCGHIQSRRDWLALGMEQAQADRYLGYSCIGRWLNPLEAVEFGELSKGFGCRYTGNHNPNISPFQVIIGVGDEREERPTFGWATS